MSNHRFTLPRPVPRKGPSPEELERVKALLMHIMRNGMTFRPWLVTRDGEVVGEVPDRRDEYLMKAHLFFKESQNSRVLAKVNDADQRWLPVHPEHYDAKVHTPETNPAA